MGHVARYLVGVAGAQLALLAADGERHRTLEDEAELLVLVVMLGHRTPGLEVDDGESHPPSVDDSRGHAIAKGVRAQLAERSERIGLTQRRGR